MLVGRKFFSCFPPQMCVLYSRVTYTPKNTVPALYSLSVPCECMCMYICRTYPNGLCFIHFESCQLLLKASFLFLSSRGQQSQLTCFILLVLFFLLIEQNGFFVVAVHILVCCSRAACYTLLIMLKGILQIILYLKDNMSIFHIFEKLFSYV